MKACFHDANQTIIVMKISASFSLFAKYQNHFLIFSAERALKNEQNTLQEDKAISSSQNRKERRKESYSFANRRQLLLLERLAF